MLGKTPKRVLRVYGARSGNGEKPLIHHGATAHLHLSQPSRGYRRRQVGAPDAYCLQIHFDRSWNAFDSPWSGAGTRRGVTTPTSQGRFTMPATPFRRGCRTYSRPSRARTPQSFIAPSARSPLFFSYRMLQIFTCFVRILQLAKCSGDS